MTNIEKMLDIDEIISDGFDANLDDTEIIEQLLEKYTAEELYDLGYGDFIYSYMTE